MRKTAESPVCALDGNDILEQGSSYYRYEMERGIKTYKSEAHRDEEKNDDI